jgi:predicted nucleic acid-binding protein
VVGRVVRDPRSPRLFGTCGAADAGATYASVIRHLPIDVANDATQTLGLDEIELTQRHQLSVYDAAYLALAKSRELLLATLDQRLAGAASLEEVYFAT